MIKKNFQQIPATPFYLGGRGHRAMSAATLKNVLDSGYQRPLRRLWGSLETLPSFPFPSKVIKDLLKKKKLDKP